jgi:hypothetical protein
LLTDEVVKGLFGALRIVHGEIGEPGNAGGVAQAAGVAIKGGEAQAFFGELELLEAVCEGGRSSFDDGAFERVERLGIELAEEGGSVVTAVRRWHGIVLEKKKRGEKERKRPKKRGLFFAGFSGCGQDVEGAKGAWRGISFVAATASK